MKPVKKGISPGPFSRYSDAKPELLRRLGLHCSYCEESGSPQALHVEHIYPKDPHPEKEKDWDNFLVACSSCNSYKNIHQGSAQQNNLEARYLWPHLDNTFSAFDYYDDGGIEIAPNNQPTIANLAELTIEMCGALKNPGRAADYDKEIAYDGTRKRKEMWEIAQETKDKYIDSQGRQSPNSLSRKATKLGHFSIWMKVFEDRPEVRVQLIDAFKADPACFDVDTKPCRKGRL